MGLAVRVGCVRRKLLLELEDGGSWVSRSGGP